MEGPVNHTILSKAQQLSHPDFPTTQDILTIIKIESNFNPKAINGVSRGLMQVNHGSMNPSTNMKQGVKLLREYYLTLDSMKSAVIAYNIGIGNYLKGRVKKRGREYWNKFKYYKPSYLTLEPLELESLTLLRSESLDIEATLEE